MKSTTEKIKKKKGHLYQNFVQLLAVGVVTGIFAGAIATAFNILVHEGEHISRDVYAYVRENPAFLPLLFLALFGGAFLLSVAVNISSVIRGCGIPQAEGGTRGSVCFIWWRDLTLMFASCLLSIFMGLSIGAEGPSVLIGACAGDGVSSVLRRNQMIRKYQIAGGACTHRLRGLPLLLRKRISVSRLKSLFVLLPLSFSVCLLVRLYMPRWVWRSLIRSAVIFSIPWT